MGPRRPRTFDGFLTKIAHLLIPSGLDGQYDSYGMGLKKLDYDDGAIILIVDDEEPIRQLLRAQLTARGYFIYEARGGNEVLDIVPALQPDVILLDLGLPDMDGIEVTQRLRLGTEAPIIILSVRSGEFDKIAALEAGADDFLTKPCYSEELFE